jgi:GNAT superfamily N-acetyltransferase
MKPAFTTRPVRLPEDNELLLSIYSSTRESEISAFGWTKDEVSRFVNFQFDAQSRYYASYFPEAEHSVVVVDGTPAGRLLVDRTANAVHIVDISLLPSFRRGGIGAALVRRLLEEAEVRGVPVTGHVEPGNEARLFWKRMGFVEHSGPDAYIALEYPCGTSPP